MTSRRGFFGKLFGVAAAAVLPITTLSWCPVKQQIVKPKIPSSEYLLGYKGSQFLNTGYVYAPYIPLIQTCYLVDPKLTKQVISKKGSTVL